MCIPVRIRTPFQSGLICNYAGGDYVLLYKLLSSYDRSCVYNQSCTDAAVNQLQSVLTDALNSGGEVGDGPGPRVPHTCTCMCLKCLLSLYCCCCLPYTCTFI
jgi:hypothetical protein